MKFFVRPSANICKIDGGGAGGPKFVYPEMANMNKQKGDIKHQRALWTLISFKRGKLCLVSKCTKGHWIQKLGVRTSKNAKITLVNHKVCRLWAIITIGVIYLGALRYDVFKRDKAFTIKFHISISSIRVCLRPFRHMKCKKVIHSLFYTYSTGLHDFFSYYDKYEHVIMYFFYQ